MIYRTSCFLFVLSLLTACSTHSHWEEIKTARKTFEAQRLEPSPLPGYHDFRGAIHVHSYISHDSKGTPDEILQAAKIARLNFLIMTDHNNPRIYQEGMNGRYGNLLVIRGAEIGMNHSYILAIGLPRDLDPPPHTMEEALRQVKALGGMAIVAHPKRFRSWDSQEYQAMEIYNLLDSIQEQRWRYPRYLFDFLYSFDSHPEELFLSVIERPDWGLNKWDEINRDRKITAIGTSDAHQNVKFLGRRLDPYSISLRFVDTHILASRLDQEKVLSALRSGHAYVSHDLLADPTGFQFFAADRTHTWIMGDDVPLGPGLQLNVKSPLSARIRLFKNGEIIRETVSDVLALPVPTDGMGIYRAELSLKVLGKWWPWIFSNPIYIKG
ncbi:MAG TPA: CehA/McbA family metallohydrolase [Nitrospiria bacterium]|jgi:hypothetical protein|nr:CehA/McbA family metallohydrolase [Nitrospiria bacterium]